MNKKLPTWFNENDVLFLGLHMSNLFSATYFTPRNLVGGSAFYVAR